MLIIISPAKRMSPATGKDDTGHTFPRHLDKSARLVEEIRKLSPEELQDLMNVNAEIARLNFERYRQWETPFDTENAGQALLAFRGDVYRTMDPLSFTGEDLDFARDRLRILSGLYGILRPLDLIRPYRLEMGSKFSPPGKRDLYEFWSDAITSSVNEDMKQQKEKVLVNLASREYFRALDAGKLEGRTVVPAFKQYREGKYRVAGIPAKLARGMMTRFIIQNRIEKAEEIKLFSQEGYSYDENLSSAEEWVFTR